MLGPPRLDRIDNLGAVQTETEKSKHFQLSNISIQFRLTI